MEDLSSDTAKEDKTRTDEKIKTEGDNINNEETSSLKEEKSYAYY